MANEKSKKRSDDDDKSGVGKRTSAAGGCKPCTSLGKSSDNEADKERNNIATKTPSTNLSNTSSCYAKCAPKAVDQKYSNDAVKTVTPNSPTTQSSATDVRGICEPKTLAVTNPFIEKMEEDILYHIALGNKSHDLSKMFGDIKFVVMGGTPKRMEQFAYYIANEIGHELPAGTILNDISKNSHRYAMYKVGPVLSVSHGMGMPSIGILLHELIKLVSHAGVKDATFFRIGTCGGFDKKAGTVVVSNKVVNDYMEPFLELAILGKKVRFPANLNQTVVNEVLQCAAPQDEFDTIAGVTYCTDNFYEGSGRLDGAFCEFSEQDSQNYYKELQRNGVVNVEMESLAFATLTCRAGIKSAVITVILCDRLETNQIKQPKEVLDEWQTRPQKLLAKYIKKKLSISDFTATGPSDPWTTKSHPINAAATDPKSDSGTASKSETSVCDPCSGLTPNTGSDSKAASAVPSTACKSCAATGTTVKPILDTVSKSPTDDAADSVCKPCVGFSSKSATNAAGVKNATTAASKSDGGATYEPSSVCKPCTGYASRSATTDDWRTAPSSGAGTNTTSRPANERTSKSRNDKTSSVCKPCVGISSKPTPEAVAATVETTTQPPPAAAKRFPTSAAETRSASKANGGVTLKSSACKPCAGFSSKPSTEWPAPTSTATATAAATATSTTSKPNGNTANSKFSVCKPCVGFSSRPATEWAAPTSARGTTTTAKSNSNTTSKSSVCKPCVGYSSSRPATEWAAPASTTAKPNGNATTAKSSVCKPCVGFSSRPSTEWSAPNTSSRPTNGTTTKPRNDKSSSLASSACKPCIGAVDTTTAQPRTAAIDTSAASKPSNGNSSVCKPCAVAANTKQTTQLPAAVRPSAATPTRASFCKKYFGTDTPVDITDSSAASKPSPAAAASSSKPTSENASVCKPCMSGTPASVSESETTAPTSLPSTRSTPRDQNGSAERTRSRCVPMKCYAKGRTDDDVTTSSDGTPKTYAAKDFDSSSKSTISNESWRSCYQKCSKIPLSTEPASTAQHDSDAPATATTIATGKPPVFHTPGQDSLKGVATLDQRGPCCDPQSSPKTVIDDRGPCCSANSKNSSSSDECVDDEADKSETNERKSELEEIEKQTKNEANGTALPTQGGIDGCPIYIRTPCNYSNDNTSSSDVQSQTTPSLKLDVTACTPMPPWMPNGTPVPSPDTPDTSTNRALPAFVTPTPPFAKVGPCCSKLSRNGGASALTPVPVTSVNNETNKNDQSASPCAACKKYYESKNQSFDSTSSDSQPEIVKCPHKLKRLKDECQGYD